VLPAELAAASGPVAFINAVWSSTPDAPGATLAISSIFFCVAASFTVPRKITFPSFAVTLTGESFVAGSADTLSCTSFAIASSLTFELEQPPLIAKIPPTNAAHIPLENIPITPPQLILLILSGIDRRFPLATAAILLPRLFLSKSRNRTDLLTLSEQERPSTFLGIDWIT
jgi:hypothetical protein